MCLYTKDIVPKTAKRNIICWKKLFHCNESEIRGFMYEIGVRYDITTGMSYSENRYFPSIEVEKAFHSWKNKPLISKNLYTFKVVICVIPKGSKYFEGYQHNNQQGYASDAIIVYDYTTWYQKLKFWLNYLRLK